jgi:hypothetical protein
MGRWTVKVASTLDEVRLAGPDHRGHQEDRIPPDQTLLDETVREVFGAL